MTNSKPRLTLSEFDVRAEGLTLKPAVREATWRVLVGGETWAAAATAMGVSQSSIKRAIDRIMQERCPCCGQTLKPRRMDRGDLSR